MVFCVRNRGLKLTVMLAVILVSSFLLCYRDRGSLAPQLDQASKGLLISRLSMDSYNEEMARKLREEALKERGPEVSTEVEELKEDSEKRASDVKSQTAAVKKAYLTFDDGPSPNTDKILDILDQYNVKGNFFVIGRFADAYKDQYRRIIKEGHVCGMHSYSHIYTEVYGSEEAFTADLNHVQYVVYDITGYMPSIYRFPGGSNNEVAQVSMNKFTDVLDKRGIVYYDWNVNSGDADTLRLSKQEIIDNVFEGINALPTPEDRNEIMILFHDLAEKTTTVDALPAVIEGLQAQGYVILPIDDYTKPIQY
ncbi:MAG: polysaccharide deacetylase [Lachnospiraceae bacterium]|nr:polysaccharide deacetylase [Lachnospiraceae bacterium]